MTRQVVDIQRLSSYIKVQLENRPVRDDLEALVRSGKSTAGKRPEEVFTAEFLCPVLRKFFNDEVWAELNLSKSEIKKHLGTEGYKKRGGFGFTPASRRAHLFTKSLVLEPTYPRAWLKTEKQQLSRYQACPDFAIEKPLLSASIVGEVKYFSSGSTDHAIEELYNASRQALFYLGAFHNIYESAMIVIADASDHHTFFEGLGLLREDLVKRFGPETNIHLVPIKLR